MKAVKVHTIEIGKMGKKFKKFNVLADELAGLLSLGVKQVIVIK